MALRTKSESAVQPTSERVKEKGKRIPHVLSALTITVDGTGEDSDDDDDESCRVTRQLREIGRRDVCVSDAGRGQYGLEFDVHRLTPE